MKLLKIGPLVIAALALAACGPNASPTASTSAAATAPDSNTASSTPTAVPATAAPTADPLAGLPAFPTIEQAHDYAAHEAAKTFSDAVVVTDSTKCPTAEGAACYEEGTQRTDGTNAAYFTDSISFNPTGAADIVYLYQDGAGWHWMDSLGTQQSFPSIGTNFVAIDSGCANIHSEASVGSAVVACVPGGATITIDQGPTYADGHIWWHSSDWKGWVAHDNLIAGFKPGTQSH